ncbi:anhydro-N-acetylmuramic acid kinase [Trichothermofontia sichuanensis B231]|uniref:anhydro-N-acetylmuramic acid kinase n=1 Tax=Trichothermofontia sichuanensis TaxID=3045816 RepID=UPI00224564CD|nr:anhydro-N-acetylmuramic acid kinase [Trichothermofontia sichuanensis]UZQ55934.1 anhydro-N-acetylmuramic acid kinase [Trichothermofontia sichuanensis B231]
MRVVGLMSGTSVDGIDAALVEIAGTTFDLQVNCLAAATYPYPAALRQRILDLAGGGVMSLAALADLDEAIAQVFATAACEIQQGCPAAELIGSHGQTVYHRPPGQPHPLGYSLQLGRGATIAALTGLPTVTNFRAADLALGGQGAPLVPRVDAYLLSDSQQDRCVQNIGGIGNVTYLPAWGPILTPANPVITAHADFTAFTQPLPEEVARWEQQIKGWDTGPGNILLDLAVQHFSRGQHTYDQDGVWAAQGTVCQALVEQWLCQPFFQQPPPKSTGREHFGRDYLQQCLADGDRYALSPADQLATLSEFTAATIAHSYRTYLPRLPHQVYVAGGGAFNPDLMGRLARLLAPIPVATTEALGLSVAFKEAIAFAVLAYWRYQDLPGNLPSVTGARALVPLGDLSPGGTRPDNRVESRSGRPIAR